MLTALGQETDRVVGFETGADDYVTKPFSPRELALRVRSVLRRARGGGLPGEPAHGVVCDGGLAVDLGAHEARLGPVLLALTSREYDLLVFLMSHPRQAFTREQLLEQVWSWSFGDTSTVTVHVRRREKLGRDPTLPRRIVTVWGLDIVMSRGQHDFRSGPVDRQLHRCGHRAAVSRRGGGRAAAARGALGRHHPDRDSCSHCHRDAGPASW